jgi:hypothetical protein
VIGDLLNDRLATACIGNLFLFLNTKLPTAFRHHHFAWLHPRMTTLALRGHHAAASSGANRLVKV